MADGHTTNHAVVRERLGVLRERRPELARQIQIYALYAFKGLRFGASEFAALGVVNAAQLEGVKEDIDKLLRETASASQASPAQEEAHRGG